MKRTPLSSNEIEAANRAEATALLIRSGYRVYHPEADIGGEDLVLRTPGGELRSVQLKSRVSVDRQRYGRHRIWMLFPDSRGTIPGRDWFLIEHNRLYGRIKASHGHTRGWKERWSSKTVSRTLRDFLQPYVLQHGAPGPR
jgi:hypothetical protein